MKSNSGAVLGLALACLLTAAPARAEDAPQSCEVPAYLLTSERHGRCYARHRSR